MMPALLFWLNRKYGNALRKFLRLKVTFIFSCIKRRAITATLLLLLLLTIIKASGQEKKLVYKVFRNKDEVGNAKVIYRQDTNSCQVTVISDVKFRIILLFSLYVIEEVLLNNNLMAYSSMNRKLNGSEKINRQTKVNGNSYLITNSNKATTSAYYPVYFHVLQLYIKEPVNVQQVYSENLQQFIELKKTGMHSYRLVLPGGDYTEYSYDNGICTRVQISYTFYSATMILQQ